MSTPDHPINTAPLEKALKSLKQCHADIADGNSTVERLKKELDQAMETTDASNEAAVNSIATLKIRLDLLPGFIRKVMFKREDLSRALKAQIEPLWIQLETALRKDQELFKDQHEKLLRPIFGDNTRGILNQSPHIPSGNWSQKDRESLLAHYENTNKSVDPCEDYSRDEAYDRVIIAAAEHLLEICAAHTPYHPKKAA